MKLTRQAFADWLESRRDSSFVGDPEHTGNCPLCQFLKATGIATEIEMNFTNRDLSNGRGFVKNPKWMETFQRRAVAISKWTGMEDITARTAREILDNV